MRLDADDLRQNNSSATTRTEKTPCRLEIVKSQAPGNPGATAASMQTSSSHLCPHKNKAAGKMLLKTPRLAMIALFSAGSTTETTQKK